MGWLDAARRVVENKQYEVINPVTGDPVPTHWGLDEDGDEGLVATNGDGVMLDGITAQLLLQVHDALGSEAQARFLAMDVITATDVSWKLAKR